MSDLLQGVVVVRTGDRLDLSLSCCSCHYITTTAILCACFSYYTVNERPSEIPALTTSTGKEQVLREDRLKGIRSPFLLNPTEGSMDHHLAALILIPGWPKF